MIKVFAAAAAAMGLGALGCRGTIPERHVIPDQGIAAVLVGGRMILPSGRTRNGRTFVNFETEGGDRAEVYRLPISGAENSLFPVEPGTYRLAPTRSLFGFYQAQMQVVVEGRPYRLPFPRDILRLSPYVVKPNKIVALGILEARIMPALPGRRPEVRVRLDDSAAARRSVVQDMIREMMDPTRPADARESAIAWSRALQNSLMDIIAEEGRKPMFTPAE